MICRVLRTWCTMRYVGRLRVTTDDIRRQNRIIRRIKDFTHRAHNVFQSYIIMTAHDDIIIINRNVTYFMKYIFLSWIFLISRFLQPLYKSWVDIAQIPIPLVRYYCYLLRSTQRIGLWRRRIVRMITKPWYFWLK